MGWGVFAGGRGEASILYVFWRLEPSGFARTTSCFNLGRCTVQFSPSFFFIVLFSPSMRSKKIY